MKLTEKTVTREALEALAVEGAIYLVQINTDKPGYHYISGFESKEQSRMYRALLNGLSFDYSYAQSMEIEEAYSNIYVEANTTFTPVSEYHIQTIDYVHSTHPNLTSQDLLAMANDLLAPKQVEAKVETVEQATLSEFISELNIQVEKCEAKNSNPNMLTWTDARHWLVTLVNAEGDKLSIPYSQGLGHKLPPTAEDVLDCLASDSSLLDCSRDFKDWKDSLG